MTFTPLEASSGADKSSSGENRFPTGGLLSGFKHLPVMPEEVIKFLECESGGIYIDGTLGSGGHAAEILKASSPGGRVIGIDWDEEAIAAAPERLIIYSWRIGIVREQ